MLISGLFLWKKIRRKAGGGEQVLVDAEIAGKERLMFRIKF
jgi:hypothetical protein